MEPGARCRFVQIGDIHLGTQQYNSPERLNDFGRAWMYACEHIARTRPDFVVCTGDLFNRFTINPVTFDQAHAGLTLLRDAGVPIVDIAGNHDRARYGEGKSWLESFADQGLLTYLDVDLGADGPRLAPFLGPRSRGSYVEWNGCRIIGLRYLGASTERVLESLEAELDRLGHDLFTILVVHAGLEGIIPHFNAELTPAAVERLRERVDYLALGHIHKSYHAVGDLAHNAGSLETWALNEWGWPRGILEVEVDSARSPVVTTRLLDVPRRHFAVVRLDVSAYETPEALLRDAWDRLHEERDRLPQDRPVAVLTLFGHLRFDASALPVNRLEDAMREILDPLVASVREYYDRIEIDAPEAEADEVIDRAVLERAVLRAQLSEDERLAPHAERLSRLALELKEQALRDGDGASMAKALRSGLDGLTLARPSPSPSPESSQPDEASQQIGFEDTVIQPTEGSGLDGQPVAPETEPIEVSP